MEALQLYNNKIDIEPSSHTLLIGRAKIKFLLGNTETALSDLSKAKAINSNDPAIENLRRLIEDGNVEAVNTGNYGIVNSEAISGVFGLMEQGKGKEAFDLITEMEEDGYNRAFAFINKSACCLLELDVPGCSEYLSKLNTYIGTPMSVNIHILRFVAACIDGIEKRECINDLNLMLSGAPQFELTLSPIQHFLVGFRRRHRKIYNMGPIYMLDPMRSSWYI